jgi:hypothetical protein
MVLCLMDSAQGTEVSIILGHDEASLGDWLPTFREDTVIVFWEVGMSKKNGYNYLFKIVRSFNRILVYLWRGSVL